MLIRGADPGFDRLCGLGVVKRLLPRQVCPTRNARKLNGKREERRAVVPDDYALGRYEIREDTLVRVGIPIGSVHCEDPISSDLEVEYLERICEPIRSPP